MIKTTHYLALIICMFCTALSTAQTWETITSKNNIKDLYCSGDYCWVASTGGVVRVNIHDFTFQEFDVDDGLVVNYSQSLIQYHDQIWIGSRKHGITLMDNYDTVTDRIEESFLTNTYLYCFVVDSMDRLWSDGKNGAYMFDGQEWTNYNISNSDISSDDVRTISVGEDNKIWFGTDKGISVYDDTEWQLINMDNSELKSNIITSIAFDTSGTPWVSSPQTGIYTYNNGQWVNYDTTNSPIKNNYIRSIYIDHENTKWFGGMFGRVYTLSDSTWQVYDDTNSLFPSIPVNRVNKTMLIVDIDQDKEGKMWFGTQNGLYMFDGIDWYKINISRIIQNNNVKSIAIDGHGRICYGTFYGITVQEGDQYTYCDTLNSNLPSNIITAVAMDSNHTIWVATDKGISFYNGDSLQAWAGSDGIKSPTFIKSLVVDEQGTLWAGTLHGLYEYDGDKFIQHLDPEEKIRQVGIFDIAIDHSGNKWMATVPFLIESKSQGAVRFDGEEWVFYNKENSGILSNDVGSVAIEDNGTIWFGLINGVSSFDGEHWNSWYMQEEKIPSTVARTLIDKRGRKWFGSSYDGLFMFDGENWTSFMAENTMNSYTILSLATDKVGRIYVGTLDGLYIYDDVSTEIIKNHEKTIRDYALLQNYPNPFNGSTTVQYELPRDGQISLEIYNINGRLVTTLYQDYQTAGRHTVNWSGYNRYGESVSSGVYFTRLLSDGQSLVQRMLYLK